MPSLYESSLQTSSKTQTTQAIGTTVQKMPTFGNSFLQGMKYGYKGVTDTFAPFMAYRSAKIEKEILGLQEDLLLLQAQSLQTQADDVMRAGHQQSASVSYQIGQAKSSARTSMASAGVRVGAAGSSAEILASYDIVKDAQRAVIMQNAVASSFGYRRQAVDVSNQARAVAQAKSTITPWASAITAILQIGMNQFDAGGESGQEEGGASFSSFVKDGSALQGFMSIFQNFGSSGAEGLSSMSSVGGGS